LFMNSAPVPTIAKSFWHALMIAFVRILDAAEGSVACNEMGLPVAKSTGSHHLKVLREAGVVTAQIEGTRRFYVLRRDDLEARFPGVLDSVLAAEGSVVR
jgi:DNA-binding transcriptional ArsR family regulator